MRLTSVVDSNGTVPNYGAATEGESVMDGVTVVTVDFGDGPVAQVRRVRDVPARSGGIVWRKLPIPKLGSPNEGMVAPGVYLDPRDSIYLGDVVGFPEWRFMVRKDHDEGYRDCVWGLSLQVYAPDSEWALWDGWVHCQTVWEFESLKLAKARADVEMYDGLSLRTVWEGRLDVVRAVLHRVENASSVEGIGGSLSWLAEAERQVKFVNELAGLGGFVLHRLDVEDLQVVPMGQVA
jgi:hypothetical protein